MRYFLDTEFYEDGKTIEPLSIGIVAEDGREFYQEYPMPEKTISMWVIKNVCMKLEQRSIPKNIIANNIIDFIGKDKHPEFWADYAAYDWIVLCQTFGTMMQLPRNFPMFCMDVQQMKVAVGVPDDFPEELNSTNEHHSLADAHECKSRFDWLNDFNLRIGKL